MTKYGDFENSEADLKTLENIIARQGTSLLIDAIAEYTGKTASKFKMCTLDRSNLFVSLMKDLESALLKKNL